ncbi:ATPase [Streptomyces sulfonofaciens]|uniref:ATPase n=1 Tax=Streptomyces sulfonofaciens TaxID=68272 RepID=A0A919L617_9ACTN|nr:ATP-binding protein [Streptomyces sulfonofaciens]GHH85258.1 ATPase [Streptomyces sulfonofaciens]
MTAPVNCYYVLEMRASGQRVPHLHSILTAHLRYWGLGQHIDPVCRGVRELFLNVAQHAGENKTCIVELRWNGRFLTAAVSDRARSLPRPLGPARGGLATVAAVSDTWGACRTADGKIVWFTRRATSPHAAPLRGLRPQPARPTAKPTPHGVCA